jgi:hypothetical protein
MALAVLARALVMLAPSVERVWIWSAHVLHSSIAT